MAFLAPVVGALGTALTGGAFGGGLAGLLTQAATQSLVGGGLNSLFGGDFGTGAKFGVANTLLGDGGIGGAVAQALTGSGGGQTQTTSPQMSAPDMPTQTQGQSQGQGQIIDLLSNAKTPAASDLTQITDPTISEIPNLISNPSNETMQGIIDSLGTFNETNPPLVLSPDILDYLSKQNNLGPVY